MAEVTFGRLTDLMPRDAWHHEALAFTPWLAANINQLADVVGIPLELTGTEIAVETFSADILARNPMDGTVVLIENQLEVTDHTHLGQIMTYLAGLQARSVIWISPKFREAHLSAIRWLNEHTADDFSFFAVRLRVVRIGDSPYAPIFEVLEKPNGWERKLEATSRQVTAESPAISDKRRAFWGMLLERHPELAARGLKVGAESNKWFATGMSGLIIGLYIASRTCGIYVRGPSGTPISALAERIAPLGDVITAKLGVPMHGAEAGNWLFVSEINRPFPDETQWPLITDWMAEQLRLYVETFTELAGEAA